MMSASAKARLTALLTAALVLSAACGDATGPAHGPPARVQILSENLRGVVATELAAPLRLQVMDERGRGVPGVAVRWTIVAGTGQIITAASITDSTGMATARWQLGTLAGEQLLDAQAGTLPAVRFAARADPGPVDRIVLPSDSFVFHALGDTTRIEARAEDAYGNAIDTPVVWSTSDAGVVQVSNGMLTAAGNGAAPVTASAGERARTVTVRVMQRATAVRVVAFADTINALTHTRQLTWQATDRNGRPLPSAAASWTSLDDAIATVDANGLVHALAPGTARIRVSLDGVADTARLHIRQRVAAVVVTPAAAALEVGDTLMLTATAMDSAGLAVSSAAFVWQSNATSVATAAADGRVSAVGTGNAIITARSAENPQLLATSSLTVSPGVLTTAAGCTGAGAVPLDLPLGGHIRRTANAADAPNCLSFDLNRAKGQQYLVLFENMTRTGDYAAALFPGAPAANTFSATISTTGALTAAQATVYAPALPVGMSRSWDFGSGPIYEADVRAPAQSAVEPMLLRADGQLVALESAQAPVVGDTVVVYMDGVPRLGIGPGHQRAVIRFISNELMIAEDVRLQTTLRRQNGAFNTPLSAQTMSSIAAEYASYAKVQGDALFANRHNASVEASTPARVLAVHTLMMADNVWGYTYAFGNYFVFDYWVGTDGATAGISQLPQVVADNLFMHEITHMRHWGLAERAGRIGGRGNQWLVEGFARFSERLPIAARLLGTQAPARTNNVVLPRNPALNGAYYRNDVPTFLTAGQNAFSGYDNSSYVFDYFADHIALAGRDPLAALRDLAISAGTPSDADAAVARWLPGLTFGELFTRARIALYADDNGVTDSVAWTQYLQYQLRASRPAGSASALDPVNLFPKIQPGTSYDQTRSLESGSAWGYLIDGTAATGNAAIRITATPAANGIISITRIR